MRRWMILMLAGLLALSTASALADAYTDKDIVKQIQQALNDAGYDCGAPDGMVGQKTVAAITAYQTDKGLEVTAVIDDALLNALGVELSAQAKAQRRGKVHDSELLESLTEATGGLPDSLESLNDRYDWRDLKRVSGQWDGLSTILGLLEGGSIAVPDMGFGLESGELALSSVGEYKDLQTVDLTISDTDGSALLATGEELRLTDEVNRYEVRIHGSNGYILYCRAVNNDAGAANAYEVQWESVSIHTILDVDEHNVEYTVQYNKALSEYQIYLKYDYDDEGYQYWRGHYDEAGNLTSIGD